MAQVGAMVDVLVLDVLVVLVDEVVDVLLVVVDDVDDVVVVVVGGGAHGQCGGTTLHVVKPEA